MLDGWGRRRIDPLLDAAGRALAARGATADMVTVAAFVVGMAAATAVAFGWLWTGLVLLIVSRIGDGLDGAVAKATRRSDFGGFLDIVLDFAFYGAIPLGFVLLDPAANGIAGVVLVVSFYVNGGSFLAYAVLAERRGLQGDARGPKSLFFTTGLAEATETIAVFCAMCLFPAWFAWLAFGFAALTFYTALARILLAAGLFRDTG